MPITLITAWVDTIIFRLMTQREIMEHLSQAHFTSCPDLRGNLGSGKGSTQAHLTS
jgi:hypothetical protein